MKKAQMMTTIEYAIRILEAYGIHAEEVGNYDVCDAYCQASDILRYVRDNNIGALDDAKKSVQICYEAIFSNK